MFDDVQRPELKFAEKNKTPEIFTAREINQYNAYVGRTCVGITQKALKFGGFKLNQLKSPKKYSAKQKTKGKLVIHWTVQVFTASLKATSEKGPR